MSKGLIITVGVGQKVFIAIDIAIVIGYTIKKNGVEWERGGTFSMLALAWLIIGFMTKQRFSFNEIILHCIR